MEVLSSILNPCHLEPQRNSFDSAYGSKPRQVGSILANKACQ